LVPIYGTVPLWAGTHQELWLQLLAPPIGFFGTGFFSLFGSMLAELYPTSVRGAGFDGGFEERLLEAEGALGEPMMLGHGGHQDFFGFRRWGEFEIQVEKEIVVGGVVLGWEDDESACQAVTEIVVGDGGEAGFGLRAGGKLGVGAIGGKLCGGGHEVEGSFRFVLLSRRIPFSRRQRRMHAVVHAGLVDFQNESGARDGGWLKARNRRAKAVRQWS